MKKTGIRLTALFAALILALVFLLPQPSVFAAAVQNSWAEEIPALLSAGSYVEGEVVAGVVTYGKEITGDSLLSGSEEILDVPGQNFSDEEISILHIQRDDMTTEQILNRLATDQRVLFAEPNYITESTAFSDSDLLSEFLEEDSEEELDTAVVRTEDIEDLTGLQWSSWDEASFHIEGLENASMHVPGFGTTGSNMENEVIVAVLDEAIHYQHPDLINKVYRFTEEEQAALGCGEWGYNATAQSTDGVPVYWDSATHGTHCAGIIGAAWDGKGISGVASNVKLISIQIGVDDGCTSLVNCLRGFEFIDKARSYGINIALTSNSYCMYQESKALNAAIEKLGEKWGIVTVFAAGNDGNDLSELGNTTRTTVDNPYVITVGATDSSGNLSPFSMYGQTSVDLGAPGGAILSSVTFGIAEYFADATPSTNKYYEGFENDTCTLTVMQADTSGNPLSSVSETTDQSHFAGSHSMKIELDPNYELPKRGSTNELNLLLDFGNVEELGVQAGELFGFAAGGTCGIYMGGIHYINSQTGEIMSKESMNQLWVESNSWGTVYYGVPSSIDLTDFQVLVTVYVLGDCDEIYLDSFGFGTETVPYAILDGTSMAAPAVAGAAAVLKSQYPDASGEALVSLVLSHVLKTESLSKLTKTGGRFDFLAASEIPAAPLISQLEVSGNTVTIRGSGFTDAGTVTLSKIAAGKEPEEKQASCSSWSDTEVVLSLEEEFKGVLQAVLENSRQQKDTFIQFVNKSDNIYEEDLPLEKDTGQPFIFDAEGDWETGGFLLGLGDRLYYLPLVEKYEAAPAYQKLLCYDINTKVWTEAASLPEYLEAVSAVVYDGKIVLKGASMDLLPDGTPITSLNPQMSVFVYDPAADSWSQGCAEGVLKMDSLSVFGGKLILAGGGEKVFEEGIIDVIPATVRYYDLSTGVGEKIADLQEIYDRPVVVCRGDSIYALDAVNYILERIQNGQSELLEDVLPEPLGNSSAILYDKGLATVCNGVLLSAAEGILFVGPAAEDGSSDTFLLKDGGDRFEPYEKRMSDSKVAFAAVTYHNGKIYAIGSAVFEEGKRFFRATQVEKHQSGWVHDEKGWHYYDEKGQLVKAAWVLDNGKWYYLDASGTMVTGWIQVNGKWYYMSSSGAMVTGWLSYNGKWYYLTASGAMATGWAKVNGCWYYMKPNGVMAQSEWFGGYWFSAGGAWLYKPIGSWRQNSAGWWFGDTSGWYAKNETVMINNVSQTFDSAGYWVPVN